MVGVGGVAAPAVGVGLVPVAEAVEDVRCLRGQGQFADERRVHLGGVWAIGTRRHDGDPSRREGE